MLFIFLQIFVERLGKLLCMTSSTKNDRTSAEETDNCETPASSSERLNTIVVTDRHLGNKNSICSALPNHWCLDSNCPLYAKQSLSTLTKGYSKNIDQKYYIDNYLELNRCSDPECPLSSEHISSLSYDHRARSIGRIGEILGCIEADCPIHTEYSNSLPKTDKLNSLDRTVRCMKYSSRSFFTTEVHSKRGIISTQLNQVPLQDYSRYGTVREHSGRKRNLDYCKTPVKSKHSSNYNERSQLLTNIKTKRSHDAFIIHDVERLRQKYHRLVVSPRQRHEHKYTEHEIRSGITSEEQHNDAVLKFHETHRVIRNSTRTDQQPDDDGLKFHKTHKTSSNLCSHLARFSNQLQSSNTGVLVRLNSAREEIHDDVITELSSVTSRHCRNFRNRRKLQRNVKEIGKIIRIFVEKISEREKNQLTMNEWKLFAKVVDRIFFVIYITTIVVSLVTIFPQLTSS